MAAITLIAKVEMFKEHDEFLVVNLIFFLNKMLVQRFLLLGISAQVSDVAHGPLDIFLRVELLISSMIFKIHDGLMN